jgi:hypothetical protein
MNCRAAFPSDESDAGIGGAYQIVLDLFEFMRDTVDVPLERGELVGDLLCLFCVMLLRLYGLEGFFRADTIALSDGAREEIASPRDYPGSLPLEAALCNCRRILRQASERRDPGQDQAL